MKIAIISCYGEGEANSEYAKALENEFEALGHSVEILRLPFDVVGNMSSAGRRQADLLIQQYARRLSEFDYVNIHYEFLLFGRKECDVLNRVLTLINACQDNKFSVTFHNFPEGKIISPLKLKIRNWKKKLDHLSLVQIIFHTIARKQGTAIVHIFRHERFIRLCCPKMNIVVHPLRYKRNEELQKIRNNFSKVIFMEENGIQLSKDDKVISIIGTLHVYKDNISVIRALNLLPENYHLFVFGGMHKLSFTDYPNGLAHISNAQRLVLELGLTKRVHFMGYQETIEDFQNACLFSDYIVMPYKEIGESASAAVYTSLELCRHVFCTRNNCFNELSSFAQMLGGGMPCFQYDMGNYMELAEKLKTLPHEERVLKNREKFLQGYSISVNAKSYLAE